MSTPSVIDALKALRSRGGSGNRLVLSIGPVWFVFSGALGQQAIRCEAAAKAWLPDTIPMGLEQTSQLRMAGFMRDGQPKLLARTFTETADEILAAVLPLFDTVYGQSGEPTFELHLGDAQTIDNPRLMAAMRRVSKERSTAARQEVYRALIRSELLILVDDEGDMVRLGTLGNRPVFGIFSDWASLRHWDPRGHTFRASRGSPLFLGLAETDVGSILINPQGQVGGELYRNEILAIAEAIRGVSGRR
jgi:hypothetical protein